ncbi:hypothetical protein ACIA5G_51720 [Amycolatopsis sp. NPDC051758]|uniref:hypothetical protein n=1 Tax=Amycolatopsis sp. NPDC051758 TaxID=3363935 RepID=UPI0037BC12BA
MNAQHPLLGALTYRARHARVRSRWWLLPALLVASAISAIADSPGAIVVVSVAAAVVGVFGALWRRCSRAAAQVEEILAGELAADEQPAREARAGFVEVAADDQPDES